MRSLLILFMVVIYGRSYACGCGGISIEKEADWAYDIIIGKVIAEREENNSFTFYKRGKNLGATTSYVYSIDVDFAYKGNLSGIKEVYGGKGRGDCGAIFEVGRTYLIVLYKCDRGYYSFLCSDNSFLPYADYQIKYLNSYLHKNYERMNMSFLAVVITLILVIGCAAGCIVFKYYNLPDNVFRRRM